MSTDTGHSLLHALQLKQRSSDSFTCSFFHPSGSTSPCISSHSRWALPRVECNSSPVAMKLGHIVPASCFRHAPTPTQRSAAEANDPLSSANAKCVFGCQGL